MVTKANRDVLYFDTAIHKNQILQTRLETPLHTICIQNREYPCLAFGKGSLTIEAAFCGTLFFLVLFSILFLFQILNGYEKNILALDTAVKEYACFGTKLSTAMGWLDQNPILWDEEKRICYLRKKQGIPYLGKRMFSLSLYQQLCYSSYEGKSMMPEKEDSSEYVYLAEHGTVYHRNPSCVFLNPGISQISYQQVAEKRNWSGAKYYPCRRCGKVQGELSGLSVYITPYGDSWHTVKECPGLKRTVRKVLISEIGNLPACSKCGS